jgi:hypothetical protein
LTTPIQNRKPVVKFYKNFVSKSLLEQLSGSTAPVTRSMLSHPRRPDGFVYRPHRGSYTPDPGLIRDHTDIDSPSPR